MKKLRDDVAILSYFLMKVGCLSRALKTEEISVIKEMYERNKEPIIDKKDKKS